MIDTHLVLLLLRLVVEGSPVALAVAEVLLLGAAGVCGQQAAQQPQAEEWLRGGGGGGEAVHRQGQAAQHRHNLHMGTIYCCCF